jgi:AmiR/NasT family two-component response regulator
MSEISAEGYAVPLRPFATRLFGLHQRAEQLEADLDTRIVEQAKGAISARLGLTPDVAFEVLCGLARSQRRDVHDYAAAVVAKGGLLDA